MADPSSFPLKWVQAAVRSGSESVEFQSHPQIIRVRAVRPRYALCLESLRRELLWPGSQDSSCVKDLALGLRAAMPRYPEVSVKCQGFCLNLARNGDIKIVRTDFEPDQYLVVASNPNVDWHSGTGNLRRCRFAPIPVSSLCTQAQLEQGLEPGGFWSKIKLAHVQVIDADLASEECIAGGPVPAANVVGTDISSLPSPVLWRTTLGTPDRWLASTGAPLARADIRISAGLQGNGQLVFVNGGVAMRPISVDLGCPGCICVCSCEGLAVDEHQLAVLEDQAYQLRLAWIRQLVRELKPQLSKNLEHFNPLRPGPQWSQHILLGAFLGACNPVWGLLAGLGSYWFELCRDRPVCGQKLLVAKIQKQLARKLLSFRDSR